MNDGSVVENKQDCYSSYLSMSLPRTQVSISMKWEN